MIRTGSDFSGVGALKIKGYDNYFISKDGSVYNATRKLKPQERSGYLKVTLSKKGASKQIYIHRILAETFIPNPYGKKEVNHKNGDKKDNRVENLEWCTRKENATHSYQNKLQLPQKGSSHGQSKITEEDVVNIRHRKSKGESIKSLSEDFNIAISTTSQIANKKRWKHVK